MAVPDLTAVRRAVSGRRPDLESLARDLVRIPSLPGEEGPVQGLIANRLRAMGLEVRLLPVSFARLRDHPAFSPDGFSPEGRIDVIGRWPGQGGGRSLILNGHVDVVSPGDESRWTESPWSGTIRDGRLYGRGACDMKTGLAAGIVALAVLGDLGWTPAGDVIVLSVVGEESGGAGTLAAIVEGVRADGAIILEPTSLDLCPVQSGALTFRLEVAGRAAHGAMRHHGVSAIEKFELLHAALRSLERDRHATQVHPLFDDPQAIAPLSIGTIRGGDWHSTVPESVVAEGRFGVFPGESVAEARTAFEQAIHHASDTDQWLTDHPPVVSWVEGQFESGQIPADHPLVAALAGAHRAVLGGAPRTRGVPYGSDLRLFTNHAAMPAVLYGPGDLTLAHAADEWIALDEAVAAVEVLATAIARWSG